MTASPIVKSHNDTTNQFLLQAVRQIYIHDSLEFELRRRAIGR